MRVGASRRSHCWRWGAAAAAPRMAVHRAPADSSGAGGAPDGGATDGDNGGQVLPPYFGRIVLTPAALLFTGAGQSATLHAQAFDANGAAMTAPFTFTSSRPDQIAVDANGDVTSMVPVGSTQITVTGDGLTSHPLLVLIVQPVPGTVLVSDAQVIAGPKQVDPTADPLPGAQYQVTLDGVGDLAPGTMLLSSEGKAVAGQVVSTAPNGTHTDVIYTLPALLDLFARVDFQADYDYTLQTVADEEAIAAMGGSALDADIGPFKCKATIDPTNITIDQNVKFTPNLHFAAGFTKDDDSGDWTSASMVLTGNIKTSGKVTAKLAPGAIASLSCKYKWKEFVPPIAGPISALVGPRIPIGVKASLKAQATVGSMELGGKLEESADFALGFSYGANGAGDVATFNLGDPHLEPIYLVNDDAVPPAAEISASLGAYASLNMTFLQFGIADAFVGAKLGYTMMKLVNQVGSNTPNKYELKAPVIEVGPGSGIDKALSFFKGTVKFTTTISREGPTVATSPLGTFTADNQQIAIPANKPINFQIKLNPASTQFLGLSNVSGVHIYRVDNPPLIMEPLNEVQYLNGPGPNYTWTWTPKVTDAGPHLFLVGLDDELAYSLTPVGNPPQFWINPGIQVNVGQTAGNWGGTATMTWNGSGPIQNGTETVQGMETITWVPGMPTVEGISFDMVATNVTFSYTLTDMVSSSIGGCPAMETYKVTVSKTLTGAEADMQAHGHLQVIPLGPGSTLANYEAGIPDISVEAMATIDTVSTCGTSTHMDVLTGASAGNAAPMMGTVSSDATTIEGSGNFTTGFGNGSGVPTNYTTTWSLQKM